MDEARRTRLVSLGVLGAAIALAGALAWLTKDMTNVRDEPGCSQLMLVTTDGEEQMYQDVFVEELSGDGLRIIRSEGRATDVYDVERWHCTPPE